LKVLLISGSYPPAQCGVGDYTAHLAGALTRSGDFEVSVLTSVLPAVEQSSSSPIVFRTMHTWRAQAVAEVEALIRRLKPDIVHMQVPTQGYDDWKGLALMALAVRVKLRIPFVVTAHEYLPDSSVRKALWLYLLAAVANRIVVVRPGFRERVPKLLKLILPKRKFEFISNGSVLPKVTLSVAEREAVKRDAHCSERRLIVYFGFSFPHKGVDLLFRIADPEEHCLMFIGPLSADDPYHEELRRLAATGAWQGRATFTGFIGAEEAARLLAAADAAVFPYRTGGGVWNSSLHAAMVQDTFVLTTSLEQNGYDAPTNVYYARPGDLEEMRRALRQYQGTRRARPFTAEDEWLAIAQRHRQIFGALLGRSAAARG
jgi:glycosyltransferase involved in cell wall biosynthesis